MRPDLIDVVPLPPDGAARARAAGTRLVRRRQRGVGAAALVAVVMLVATGVLVGGRSPDQRLATAGTSPPPPAAPSIGGPPVVVPAAALDAQLAVPEGWQTVTYGLAQIAVPPDWRVVDGGMSLCEARPGTVLVGDSWLTPPRPPGTERCAATPFVAMINDTRINGTGTCERCEAGEVNGLTRQVYLEPDMCSGCHDTTFVPQVGLRLEHTRAVEADTITRILDTVTLSPLGRALTDGPLVDTAMWREVVEGPVTMRVPPDWPVVTPGPDDDALGACGAPPFVGPPRVVHGHGRDTRQITCPPPPFRPSPATADGVWLWSEPAPPHDVLHPARVPQGILVRVGGLDLRSERTQAAGVFEVVVPTGMTPVHLVLGVGQDPVIARTILRTVTIAR